MFTTNTIMSKISNAQSAKNNKNIIIQLLFCFPPSEFWSLTPPVIRNGFCSSGVRHRQSKDVEPRFCFQIQPLKLVFVCITSRGRHGGGCWDTELLSEQRFAHEEVYIEFTIIYTGHFMQAMKEKEASKEGLCKVR